MSPPFFLFFLYNITLPDYSMPSSLNMYLLPASDLWHHIPFSGCSFVLWKAGDLVHIGTVTLKPVNRNDKDVHFHVLTGARNPTGDSGRCQSCAVCTRPCSADQWEHLRGCTEDTTLGSDIISGLESEKKTKFCYTKPCFFFILYSLFPSSLVHTD